MSSILHVLCNLDRRCYQRRDVGLRVTGVFVGLRVTGVLLSGRGCVACVYSSKQVIFLVMVCCSEIHVGLGLLQFV